TPAPPLFSRKLLLIVTLLTPPAIQIACAVELLIVLPVMVTLLIVSKLIGPSSVMVLFTTCKFDCGFPAEPKNETEPSVSPVKLFASTFTFVAVDRKSVVYGMCYVSLRY